MKLLSVFLLVLLSVQVLVAEITFPVDSSFYNPVINAYQRTITGPSADSDHSGIIQAAIDDVNANGGGTVLIQATGSKRVYNIRQEVQLKSNVHIRVAPNVVFTSDYRNKIILFSAGKNGNRRITNFSFCCSENGDSFQFDFSNRTAGEKEGGAIAVAVGAAENFRIADIVVRDNYTPYSSVVLNLLDDEEGGATKYMFARKGIVENLTTFTGHYGYGTVQCQAAQNVLFRNLTGEGGATLRLESGAIGKANLEDRGIRIDRVFAQHISCTNGQSAVTLSPHTINNGVVFIDDVTAVSCECGAVIAAGFLSAKKGQKDKDGNPINGYIYGWFDSNSVISNVRVVYGTEAQLRNQRRIFVPCSQKYLISETRNPDNESYKGPTVAGIVYYAKAGTERELGYYTVNVVGMTMENFPLVGGKMENKEYVVAPEKDGFADCNETGVQLSSSSKKNGSR